MPKFYVQSEQVHFILDAQDAQRAAVLAFQRWCDRQTEAMFDDSVEELQLGNEISVSEIGFAAADARSFPTLDILMAWQQVPVEAGPD